MGGGGSGISNMLAYGGVDYRTISIGRAFVDDEPREISLLPYRPDGYGSLPTLGRDWGGIDTRMQNLIAGTVVGLADTFAAPYGPPFSMIFMLTTVANSWKVLELCSTS